MATYVPAAYAVSDPATLVRTMREIGFATFVTPAPGGLAISHAPVVVKPDGAGGYAIETHVARANPHWRALEAAADSVAIFQGPYAYVSPAWYATKREHGRVVPTWNYIAIHATGKLEAIEDGAWLRAHIAELTELHERDRDEPWAVGDAPDDFIAALANGIVGLRMPRARLVGKFKLGQNRPEADRLGAIAGLAATPGGGAIAAAMRAHEAERAARGG